MVCPFCPLGPHKSRKREMWVLGTFSGRPNFVLIVPTQVTLRRNVGSLDAPRVSQLFTFGPRGKGYGSERVVNGLEKSAKNWGSQWYAHSAHLAHTGHENGKCGFCGRFQGGPSIHIWPQGAG